MSEVELYRESRRTPEVQAAPLTVTKYVRPEAAVAVPTGVLSVPPRQSVALAATAEIARGRNVTHGGVTLTGIGEKSLGAEPEIETIRSRWRATQEELESQKRERASDFARMAARMQLLEEQLSDAARESRKTSGAAGPRNGHRGIVLAVAIMGLVGVALVAAIRWFPLSLQTAVLPAPVAVVEQKVPDLPTDPEKALSTAVDRLNEAIDAAPGRTPEEALRKVSKPGQGCHILWVGNGPAVLFGQAPVKQNSLAGTLADCAAAVARLR